MEIDGAVMVAAGGTRLTGEGFCVVGNSSGFMRCVISNSGTGLVLTA